jgi:hypothetical protein
MKGFELFREHSRITWIERDRGWVATPADIVTVLSSEDDRPGRQHGESDRGGPGLERDPYRDEGGEG